MNIEKRYLTCRFTTDNNTLVGLVAAYNGSKDTQYQLTDTVIERCLPNCFDAKDVVLTCDHDVSKVLARTPETLQCVNTPQGLEFRAELPDTTLARDMRELVSKNIIRGISWGCQSNKIQCRWVRDGKNTIREITSLPLHEISLVTFPAYPASVASVRMPTPDFTARIQALKAKYDQGK